MTRATRTNLPPQIKRRELPSGAIRYEVIADVTREGARHQTRKRFAKLADAKEHLAGLQGDVVRGVHVRRSALTVQQAVEAWLAGQRLRPKTRSAYITALRPVVDALGGKLVQQVTKSDIETVIRSLVEGTSATGTWNAPTKLKGKKVRSKWAWWIREWSAVTCPRWSARCRPKALRCTRSPSSRSRPCLPTCPDNVWSRSCT